MKDYYKILGISSEADPETIKRAFREKVAVLHPEKNKAVNAKEVFADLIEAYEIVSNPKKRQVYDTLIQKRESQMPVPVEPELKTDFDEYEKEAKRTSKKYKDYSWEEFLALELFLDTGIESLFTGDLDLLDDAGDMLGDIFDIF